MRDTDAAIRAMIAAALRAARKRSGMTQGELAERTGFPRTWICNVEKAQRLPSVLSLRVLAIALETSSDELLALARVDCVAKAHINVRRSAKGGGR